MSRQWETARGNLSPRPRDGEGDDSLPVPCVSRALWRTSTVDTQITLENGGPKPVKLFSDYSGGGRVVTAGIRRGQTRRNTLFRDVWLVGTGETKLWRCIKRRIHRDGNH